LVQHGKRWQAAYREEEIELVTDEEYEEALATVLNQGPWEDPWTGPIL